MKLIKTFPETPYRLMCFGLIAGVCLTILGSIFLDLMVILSGRISHTDHMADYLRGTLWALALGATIFIWPVSGHR